MKIVATSDFHGHLPDFPEGDLLIVAGDLTIFGTKGELFMFAHWLDNRPFEHIVVIGGNHDKYLTHKINPFKRAHYLLNSSVEINGIKIWGSPYTPSYQHWYFMKDRGYEIRQEWNKIPTGIDILVTHGPPHAILDRNTRGSHIGCLDLKNAVYTIRPKYHLFGHIHEDFGHHEENGTHFYNCCYVDEHYEPQNRFHIFTL